MQSLVKSYNPYQGPAFGQLTREDISSVVTKDADVVIWSIGKRSKGTFPARANGRKRDSGAANSVGDSSVNAETTVNGSVKTTAVPEIAAPETAANGSATATTTPETPATLATPAPPPAPKSWAGLFQSAKPAAAPIARPPPATTPSAAQTGASDTNGSKFTGLAGVLHHYKPTYRSNLIQPRGLVNNGNMCFMNAVLHPLSHCPPFYNLMMQIGQNVAHSFNSSTPLLDSLIMFMNEFPVARKPQEFGSPLVPEYVYDALRGLKRFDSIRGRQEDCQEFLGYLLDGLHEEFLATMKENPKPVQANGHMAHEDSTGDAGDDEWMEVTGPKNKASFTRSTQFQETPISTIFSGQLRSILRIPSQKDSVTLEPFQMLQLDLTPDNVFTIEDALFNTTIPEVLDGFTSSERGGVTVEATKKLFIESVPPVLILHLKRFIYKDGTTQKLHKEVGYKTTLDLQPELISPVRRPSSPIHYKLFGVVYHHGRNASGGHYTCDILRQNNEWLHIDDTNITQITEADVTVDVAKPGERAPPSRSPATPGTPSGVSVSNDFGGPSALAAALAASSLRASKQSDGVAYVLFYIRSDETTAAATEAAMANGVHTTPGSSYSSTVSPSATRPHPKSAAGRPNGHAQSKNQGWSVPKR
ncbi:hypothetical protein BGW41_004379 [Actinomortierella wolfii]|nr:hypothetical protein BGW41_004379 [Actinomortierella wolfii]